MPHTAVNLTRAREAFIYGVRRRSLRMGQLLGADPELAQVCLQRALSAFVSESRQLPPPDWPQRWWQLLLEQVGAGFAGPVFDPGCRREPWQLAWERMPAVQRSAFLLHAWLKLDESRSATALGLELADFRRHLATASLRLRQAAGVASADPQWLAGLSDGFDHAILAPLTARVAPAASLARPRHVRPAWVLPTLGTLAALLMATASVFLLPGEEPLPTDIALPEGASGLARRAPAAATLPDDLAMLLDPDWELWAEPETAALIRDLEFHAWRESGDEG